MERKTTQYIPRKNYMLSSCTNPKWEELHGGDMDTETHNHNFSLVLPKIPAVQKWSKLNRDPSLEE